MNGRTIAEQIRRRKSRSRRSNDCDSGAAIRVNVQYDDDSWFGAEDVRDRKQAQADDFLPPRVIYSQSVTRPIHINPAPSSRPPRTSAPPPNQAEILAAIAGAYGLTSDQVRELVAALTNARLLLGYKHPILRQKLPPTS